MTNGAGVAFQLPEVLAPAGDEPALEAALAAGADAVYFGLEGLNARARATNFALSELPRVVEHVHAREVKAYVTLNTLVFDSEYALVEQSARACRDAGVDAVIVQDLGVMRRVREVAPELALHASTQMTCTDAEGVAFAAELGARRVVLARELSLAEIERIRAATAVELEVFVHGALCVAYSGQCLTSEAIGGRSANRGACAQACRLPYELYVDGVRRDVGERAYLLSPQDLEASALVPELARAGVRSLKIEGRLKGPDFVGAVTALYRRAVDALADGDAPDPQLRGRALQAFTRGSGRGFLGGTDHQQLVEARSCDHRGLLLGEFRGVERAGGKACIRVRLAAGVSNGDGVLIEGGFASRGELGGRVWAIFRGRSEFAQAPSGSEVLLWLGPDVRVEESPEAPRRIFKTNDPTAAQQTRRELADAPHRIALALEVRAHVGEPLVIDARTARGRRARVTTQKPLERARGAPLTRAVLEDKLGRLGDTPYYLKELALEMDSDVFAPVSLLNQLRRELTDALAQAHATLATFAPLAPLAPLAERASPATGLFALCRNLEQARAALTAGVDGVYLDFLELTGTARALRSLREEFPSHVLGLAPPRIRKPGEEKIDAHLRSLEPDLLLVRGLGALGALSAAGKLQYVADFSLNVVSPASAREVLARGPIAFTPAFDLDGEQLVELVGSDVGRFAEVVLHSPIPLFHMEHCVYAALLSEGRDFHSCGRPCEQHALELRDRSGRTHPVVADVGCRNTVFHGAAQSAAGLSGRLRSAGVRRFRIELLRESAAETELIVGVYRALLAGTLSGQEAFRRLRVESGYGVVRGSLRVVD